MSLLSDFLGTEDFSLMDSPMFQELIENIKNNLKHVNRWRSRSVRRFESVKTY